MDFPKGVGKFLGWLERVRAEARNPAEGIHADAEAEEFLYLDVTVETPQSSNVADISYNAAKSELYVTFKNGYIYAYYGITVELAYDFYIAASKGRWVWDNLRTTRRAYQFLYSLNGRHPVRMEDPAATSVKAALGSLSILGRDPFSHTKSAKRVRFKFAQIEKAGPRRGRESYQFLSTGRHRTGQQRIKEIIRGR